MVETMTDSTISKNTSLHYKAIPHTTVVHPAQPKTINKPKLIHFAKNPFLWAATTWIAICAMLVLDVLYR
jgi:hypothetical protein